MEIAVGEGNDGGEVLVYICWGGYVEVRSNGGWTYHGGRSNCISLMKSKGIANVMHIVEGLGERRMW